MAVQPGLCQTWLDTQKTGFLAMRLISNQALISYTNNLELKSKSIVHILILLQLEKLIKMSNDQELAQSETKICPQNQNGKGADQSLK